MNTIEKMEGKVEHWADAHHPMWLDFLRMALGVFIFIKGVLFASHQGELLAFIQGTSTVFAAGMVAHYIIAVHLMGGLLIIIGLLTRVSVLFNLPILIGAVFFIHLSNEYGYGQLWQSLVALGLLILFLVYGSGKFSADFWMKNHPSR